MRIRHRRVGRRPRDGCKLLDRLEDDAVSSSQQRRRVRPGVEHGVGDAPDQPPPARGLGRVDAGVAVGHRQASRRHPHPRGSQPRQSEPAGHVCETRREAEEGDQVLRLHVPADDVLFPRAQLARNVSEVGAVVAGAQPDGARRRPPPAQREVQPRGIEPFGVVEDEQRARAGHRVEEPVRRTRSERGRQIERVRVGQREERRAGAEVLQLSQERPARGRGFPAASPRRRRARHTRKPRRCRWQDRGAWSWRAAQPGWERARPRRGRSCS